MDREKIDVCMGEEEKNRKQKEGQKKETGKGTIPATLTIWLPLATLMDHAVCLFLNSPPTEENSS